MSPLPPLSLYQDSDSGSGLGGHLRPQEPVMVPMAVGLGCHSMLSGHNKYQMAVEMETANTFVTRSVP